ncbi:MAG: 1-deoxy-D-xylulose-5-phosphate reductoisomerase, partial [Brasilonema sp.]
EWVCDRHARDHHANPSLDDILAADKWARQEVLKATETLENRSRIISLR